jgi:predicted nucleic acid-binding protein
VSVFAVDASVAVKWFLPEIHSEAALRLHHLDYHLHIPGLFLLEVGNILCKKERQGELTYTESNEILRSLQGFPFHHHADTMLFPLAFDLAYRTRRSLYDCQYLALAVTLNGRFVTADLRFFKTLANGPWAKYLCWVEDLP